VLLVLEGDVGELELARPFHEDLLGAVDQDIVDRVVLEKRLQRTEAPHLVRRRSWTSWPRSSRLMRHPHIGQGLIRDALDLVRSSCSEARSSGGEV
jgi:hypothetical protein